MMRKPSFKLFYEFKKVFDRVNDKYGLKQQLIPYFISSHPGCKAENMAELACETHRLNFQLEQVQDFTPTPMTLSTEMYYTGIHPYTLEPVFTAHDKDEKLAQRQFFFWYKPEFRNQIIRELQRMKRPDLIQQLFSGKVPAYSALERNGHSSGYKGAKSDNNQNNRNDDRRGYANNRNDNRKPGYGNNRRDEGNRHFNDNGRGNFGRDRNGRRR